MVEEIVNSSHNTYEALKRLHLFGAVDKLRWGNHTIYRITRYGRHVIRVQVLYYCVWFPITRANLKALEPQIPS